jgi:hypothetical protein
VRESQQILDEQAHPLGRIKDGFRAAALGGSQWVLGIRLEHRGESDDMPKRGPQMRDGVGK